jgi:hypothetical protein
MVIQRTVFTKGGVVAEVSMCERDYCDEWCRIRGYDSWAEATADAADVLREIEEGDAIAAPLLAGTRELNKSEATVTREGEQFVTNGARDYDKLRSAQTKKTAKQPVYEDLRAAD